MGKLRLKNMFFVIHIIIIFINYGLLWLSYYIQNNTGWAGKNNIFNLQGLDAWNTAISLSEISLIIIVVCFIIRIISICIKKLNLMETLASQFINLIAMFFCLIVIFDRI